MNENKGNQPATSDEIDLGQLFRLIGRGFDGIFQAVLRIFLYFKRNLLWFAGLLVVGVLIGLLLRQVVVKRHQLDVIVTPNLYNEEYLSNVISEISSNIKTKDEAFIRKLGMDPQKIADFELELIPLREKDSKVIADELNFLEILKDFGNIDAYKDVVRTELLEKTTKDHQISFYFKDPEIGEEYSRRIIDYINSNEFYNELLEVHRENALKRIQQNDSLISQIDVLVRNYSEKMRREQDGAGGQLILESQAALNVPSLLTLKNTLIQNSEEKQLELVMRKNPVQVVSFGKPYEVRSSFFKKWLVLIPLLLIGGFLLLSFSRYLDRKAKERNL